MKSENIITALKSVPEIVAICGDYMYSHPPIRTPEGSYLYFTFAGRERTQVTNSDIIRVTIHSKKVDEIEVLEDLLIENFEKNFIPGNYQSIFISSNPEPIPLKNGFFATILRFKVWQTI